MRARAPGRSGGTLARRALRAAATLAWVFLLCFLLVRALPGDPLDRLDSPGITAEQAERTRRALGLDRPLAAQLARTLASYARGDLGVSFTRKRPVADVLAGVLPYTALLGAAALSLAYTLGPAVALALIAARPRVRRAADRVLLVLGVVPRFWLGVMLVLVLHGQAGWLPASHAFSPGGGGWIDLARHLVLPALALGLPAAFVVARFQLAAMESAVAAPHVLAARATGSSGWPLLSRHVLRPGLGPTLALLAIDLPVIVSGAIVVEVVFAWPGLGRLTADAVLGADHPLALAASVLTGGVVLAARGLAGTLSLAAQPYRRAAGAGGRG